MGKLLLARSYKLYVSCSQQGVLQSCVMPSSLAKVVTCCVDPVAGKEVPVVYKLHSQQLTGCV